LKIVILSISHSGMKDAVHVYRELMEEESNLVPLSLYNINSILTNEEQQQIAVNCQQADFVLFDVMSTPLENIDFFSQLVGNLKGMVAFVGSSHEQLHEKLSFGSLDYSSFLTLIKREKSETITSEMKHDFERYMLLQEYWRHGGQYNIQQFFRLLLKEYGGFHHFPTPLPLEMIEDVSIYDPCTQKSFADVTEWKEAQQSKQRPTVALFYIGHQYPNKSDHCVAHIIEQLSNDCNVLPIAFTSVVQRDLEKLKTFLIEQLDSSLQAIISFLPFRLGAGPRGGLADVGVDIFKKANVPVFHPFFISKRTVTEWEEKREGIQAGEFIVNMMLPELDGAIHTYPVGALGDEYTDDELDVSFHELTLIDERVEALISRVKKYLQMRQKTRAERKVAINCYNYPPGEGNLFGGSFLDTFKSIENILSKLHNEGYDVEPMTSEQLQQHFTAGKLVNSGQWITEETDVHFIKFPVKEYLTYVQNEPWYKQLVKQWGEPAGEIMASNEQFFIPGLIVNHVFIGLQPTRGVHEDPSKVYHDELLYPHHQYIAYYVYLRHIFKADAILHVGTHGTLEFLPGKENALSGECFPDWLIGDMPHFYYYYVGNPAEAMIAKRRTHGTLISYQSPPFVEAELHGELIQLEHLLNEYDEAQHADPIRLPEIEQLIIEKSAELHFSHQDLEEIEQELYRIKRSLIPYGLHIIGRGYTKDEAKQYMSDVLRYEHPTADSLRRVIAEDEGINFDKVLANKDTKTLVALDEKAEYLIDYYLLHADIPKSQFFEERNDKRCRQTLQFGLQCYQVSMENQETKSLIHCLDGEYNEARIGGDLIRYPDILPTGANIVQFDPRLVPSVSAYQRGARLAEQAIDTYVKKHGSYPKSTAVVCWGLETSRTHGETVGQILAYLGIRLKNPSASFNQKYEIIPVEELGRPRINVVINICGFFRDMFPNIIEDINELCQRLAEVDENEKENYFKAHSETLFKKYKDEGMSDEQAKELATTRIFGPEAGGYGTNVRQIIQTKQWEQESQLAEAYMNSLHHLYTKSFRGEAMPQLLTHHLSAVDIVSQVRSNHEYEITDLDHYYEYFGGLAKAIETAKGEKAEMLIHDTTGEFVETDEIGDSIARGVRTRLLNPKWIEGMLEHSYHGVQKIAERFENVLGLAATTNKVDQWVFDNIHETYVQDEDMRERLKENNRWAYMDMLDKLFEMNERGYWDASEQQLSELQEAFLDAEGEAEEAITQ